jgi:hypothetical protein
MSTDETGRTGAASGVAPAGTNGAIAPLVSLGDADAAVCTDGFCEVPSAAAQVSPARTGADE